MPMPQSEIDEISNSFIEAYRDTFGGEVYILKLKEDVEPDHPLYNERIGKSYDRYGPFYATYKRNPTATEVTNVGLRDTESGIVTIVTKSLRDAGITEIKNTDLVVIVDQDGKETTLAIKEVVLRVQLGTNYLFTVIGVEEPNHGST